MQHAARVVPGVGGPGTYRFKIARVPEPCMRLYMIVERSTGPYSVPTCTRTESKSVVALDASRSRLDRLVFLKAHPPDSTAQCQFRMADYYTLIIVIANIISNGE